MGTEGERPGKITVPYITESVTYLSLTTIVADAIRLYIVGSSVGEIWELWTVTVEYTVFYTTSYNSPWFHLRRTKRPKETNGPSFTKVGKDRNTDLTQKTSVVHQPRTKILGQTVKDVKLT